MYRRPKFLELLLAIREEMAEEAEYDLDLFTQNLRATEVKRRNAPKSARDKGPVNGSGAPAKKAGHGPKR